MKRAWALLTLPGMAWLAAFFLVAFYAVVAVGLGNITDLYDPVPHWNPLDWNVGYLLYASLDRIDQRLIEAARDLGTPPSAAFRRVVLPLSKAGTLGGIVLIALPMFGDYYTPDLISGSPKTAMLGNTINNYVQGGPDKALGAALTLLLSAFLLVFSSITCERCVGRNPAHDPRACCDAPCGNSPGGLVPEPSDSRGAALLRRGRVLPAVTWLYVAWSLLPVLLAIRFAFNQGRSRTSSQGFSLRWFWTDPTLSVRNDPTLWAALQHSLVLAGLAMLIATPLGTALAIGLQRWRGRGSGVSNVLMLLRLVTPELVFAVGLFLLFTSAFRFIGLGTTAQVIGHVTFSLSWVVLIVRGRLVTIGRDVEEAAADLGAPPWHVLRRILLPLLAPAIAAGLLSTFALSIDDFVVAQYMASGADTTTVPMRIYATARAAPTPALNALATIMLVFSLLALTLAWLLFKRFSRGQETSVSTFAAGAAQ